MTKELRVLTFLSHELQEALQNYAKNFDVKVPEGTLTSFTMTEKKPQKMFFEFSNNPNQNVEHIELDPKLVAACLVELCRSQKIPLPLKAKKSIEITDDKILLWLQMGSDYIMEKQPGYVVSKG